jgi:hypothetical protein
MERKMQQMMQQLLTIMYVDREDRKADKIAHREFMRQMITRPDDNRERDQEDLRR